MQPGISRMRRGQSGTRSASDRLSPALFAAEEDQPLPGKRPKLDHTSTSAFGIRAAGSVENAMYSFSSNVINLTRAQASDLASSPQERGISTGVMAPAVLSPSTGGSLKLIVKNRKISIKSDPDGYCHRIWAKISDGLDTIFAQDTKPFSMEELYMGVENTCKQNRASVLFEKLQKRCEGHVGTSLMNPLREKSASGSDTDLLRAVAEAWATWRRQLTTIRSIFYYMDRSYLLRSHTDPSIDELGIDLFRDKIFNDSALKPRIVRGTCDLLSKDRKSDGADSTDTTLFREAIAMFHTLVVYTKEIEPSLLAESQSFFNEWAMTQAPSLSLSQYVEACRTLMSREIARCKAHDLEETTRRDLETQMESFLVVDQEEWLTHPRKVAELMEKYQLDTLCHLFDLLQLKLLGSKLRVPFEQYITTHGSSIVFDENREAEMVPRLLAFKKKLDTIWEQAFKKHNELGISLRESFRGFINKTRKSDSTWRTNNDKPGEMIAKYVDLILRNGSKAIPQVSADGGPGTDACDEQEVDNEDLDEDEQMNKQLEHVLEMFRFVQGKAVFEGFYKTALAKRLLMNRSASFDAEKSMLTRLRSECGEKFTQNLEQMFKDIEMAREENSAYKTVLQDKGLKPEIDLSVNVCSAAAWPSYQDITVEVPIAIQKATDEYETYYKATYVGRTLQWKHSLAHCQMTANFPKGRKEIIVSGFQAITMLYFNGKSPDEQVTYEELAQATRLEDVELKRTLQSLACARYRVLTKSPKGKDVNTADKFTVNLNFSDPKYRIKINQIQLKETRKENKDIHERVAMDRSFETQAAIVRIMKSKKNIKHSLLVVEVIDATKSRGSVDADDIKKQIEKLIDKDYMERSDNGTYEYVA